MDTSAADRPEPVVLIIADISGYTRYMTANIKTLAHSQTIITELVKAIVHAVELPLEVAKLEGDAVFLFGRKGAGGQDWAGHKRMVGEKLLLFFDLFRKRVQELTHSTTCNCNACTHIESLRLKVIAHSGEAVFHQVFRFQELAGVDVIIVHRLLKNSIAANQYLLLTASAQQDFELPAGTQLQPGVETYEDIGRVHFGVYYPGARLPAGAPGNPAVAATFNQRFNQASQLFFKLWFGPLRSGVSGDRAHFHHLPGQSKLANLAFAFLTLSLTPIYVPVAMFRVAWRARNKARFHSEQRR